MHKANELPLGAAQENRRRQFPIVLPRWVGNAGAERSLPRLSAREDQAATMQANIPSLRSTLRGRTLIVVEKDD